MRIPAHRLVRDREWAHFSITVKPLWSPGSAACTEKGSGSSDRACNDVANDLRELGRVARPAAGRAEVLDRFTSGYRSADFADMVESSYWPE